MNLVQEVEEKITQMNEKQYQELQTWLDDYETLRWGNDLKKITKKQKNYFCKNLKKQFIN